MPVPRSPSEIAAIRERVARIVEGFPEARAEMVLGAHLKLEVRGKRFGWFMEDHHGDGRLAIECKAPAAVAEGLVAAHPDRYYHSKFARNRGLTLGVWLDVSGIDWDEIADLLEGAYGTVAPKNRAKRPLP